MVRLVWKLYLAVQDPSINRPYNPVDYGGNANDGFRIGIQRRDLAEGDPLVCEVTAPEPERSVWMFVVPIIPIG